MQNVYLMTFVLDDSLVNLFANYIVFSGILVRFNTPTNFLYQKEIKGKKYLNMVNLSFLTSDLKNENKRNFLANNSMLK